MSDVILYIPPISFVAFPTLGIPLLTGFLSKYGYNVKVEDINMKYFNNFEKKISSQLEKECDSKFELYKREDRLYLSHISDNYDLDPSTSADKKFLSSQKYKDARVHGIGVISGTSYNFALEMAKCIKKQQPNSIVVLGGNYFFDKERCIETLNNNPYVDIICRGEGEYTLLELCEKLDNSQVPLNIKGTVVRRGKKIILNEMREPIKDLNSLPFADFSQLPLENYLNFRIGTRVLPLSDGRGCPYNCVFCNENRIWGSYRFRNPENIVAEMKFQHEKHKVEIFRFCSSVINVYPKNLERLSKLLKQEDLEVMWGGYARINKGMDFNLLKNLYEAGCRFLGYGIESGSPRLLEIMKKYIDLELASKVLKATKEAGISVVTFWLTDFPGERWDDIEKTKDFLLRNKDYIDIAFFSKFIPFKYSAMYENPELYPSFDAHINSHEILHEFWREIKGEVLDFQPFENHKIIGMVIF
jgi:radical SAM superfamily enzyme YgiQ (UPF0313 family)